MNNGNKLVTPHSLELEPHHLMQFNVIPETPFLEVVLSICKRMQLEYSKLCQKGISKERGKSLF